MKTPTLKEVKKFFKDAKFVECLADREQYDLSIYKYIHQETDAAGLFFTASTKKEVSEMDSFTSFCVLWAEHYDKFAKIIEPTITIEVSKIDKFSDNEKLGEYVRQLKNELTQ